MRRLALLAVVAAAAALAGCEGDNRYPEETPAAEPAPAPTDLPPVDEPDTDAPPPAEADTGYQPPETEPPSSAESVQPESETLFY